ncbi:MAG: class I SAM-dependent methyltransferase [Betaproteobacteria bacterium]|nr:class I SAM-dependent methyltransferase [Betaproteobacteria bacterium]
MSSLQPPLNTDFPAFGNRLRKNWRHLRRWAQREGVTCFRVYERDVPQFPLAVDYYEGRVHLQEFDTGWVHAEGSHDTWVAGAVDTVGEILQVSPTAIHYKRRERQRGTAQYGKTGRSRDEFIVHEGGYRFLVDLDRYLDTGLFLDHRMTRRMVGERARDKRVLNLFAYTASFTVYASGGHARSSVSVDLSNTYQEWARRNLLLNDADLTRHRLVRADVFAFLREAVAHGEQYDLIVMDPPTFSNSKKMQGTLDIQRDHVALIQQCLRLLAPEGELFFSTNLRSFELDADAFANCAFTDLSARTVPEDFRNKRIHRCWHFRT